MFAASSGELTYRDQMAKSTTFKVTNFIGTGIDAVTYKDIFNSVDKWIANKEGRSHHIACVNAFCVTLALKNKRLARIYNGADITGPDGVPFVKWIKRTLKVPCDRIAAPDTMLELAEHSKTTGYTFYLYGGDPDVVVKMKEYLEERFPHIKIVGYYSPPFRALTDEEDAAICEEINHLKPDIISVGLGTIRKSGFEWLYRLFSKDFFRLWRRYILMNIVFLWNFGLQNLHIKVRHPEKWQRPEIES